MRAFRIWTIFVLSLMLGGLIIWGSLVFYIDPLWSFNHAHQNNQIQAGFDERQQKTNFITHNPFTKGDLLLGSSRVTYISQYDFIGYDVYNYAVSNMVMAEYDDYIQYAKSQKGSDFEHIILGLDFYTTNKNIAFDNFEKPAYYIEKTNTLGYPLTSLLSLEAAQFAWDNYQASKKGLPINFFYDRQNVKTLQTETDLEITWSRIYATVDKYHQDLYANYEYEQVREILQHIKDHNPNTEFLVFTTPITMQLYEQMIKDGLYPYYRQWLEDITAVFGEVYHFMYPNSVTANIEYFYDGSHIYPWVGTWLAHKLIGYPDEDIPEDFGKIITANDDDY